MSADMVGTDSDIASELVDLTTVPLSELRDLDSETLRRSLRHAVQGAVHVSVTAASNPPTARFASREI
jgi:hypothetical protein